MRIFKRGKIWHVELSGGKRISLGTSDKKIAIHEARHYAKLCAHCKSPLGLNRIRYCSHECYTKAKRQRARRDGHVPLCRYCKSPVGFHRSRYCSSRCSAKAWREIGRFGATRQEILESFGNRCSVCGQTPDKQLFIHHVDGFGSTVPRRERNNQPKNLLPVCPWCHMRIHLGKPMEEVNLEIDRRPFAAALSREVGVVNALQKAAKIR